MADQSEMQYGVFPVVPRANETDQPQWTNKELDQLPVEFKSDDKKDDDKNKKEEGTKADGADAANKSKPTGSAPASGQPELPKA